MTTMPFRPRTGVASPRIAAQRRKVRRRPHQASAALHVLQDCSGVELPVIPLVPGGKCPRTPHGTGNATTVAAQMGRCRRRYVMASIVRLPRSLCRTRCGQV